MAKKKTRTKAKPALKDPPDFLPFEIINISAEVESILPKLAQIYHENEGDMRSVHEEIREHLIDSLDFIFNDFDDDLLEKLLKKEAKKN